MTRAFCLAIEKDRVRFILCDLDKHEHHLNVWPSSDIDTKPMKFLHRSKLHQTLIYSINFFDIVASHKLNSGSQWALERIYALNAAPVGETEPRQPINRSQFSACQGCYVRDV